MSLIIFSHFQFLISHIQIEYKRNTQIVKKITKEYLAKPCINH